jgi:hypothetical protein
MCISNPTLRSFLLSTSTQFVDPRIPLASMYVDRFSPSADLPGVSSSLLVVPSAGWQGTRYKASKYETRER